MKDDIEKEFALMVENLLQTEFCPDWNPKLLHGFMGIASEGGELLNKYLESIQYLGGDFTRTDALIELSDLVHYMQMIIGVLKSSITDVMEMSYHHHLVTTYFYDRDLLDQCTHLDPILLRGFAGISSEGGELLNRYKKFMFYHGEPYTRWEILCGLHRLFQFVQMVIDKYDSSIEEVTCINMAKLSARYPRGYAHDKAITHQRDKKAERAAIDKVINTFADMRE